MLRFAVLLFSGIWGFLASCADQEASKGEPTSVQAVAAQKQSGNFTPPADGLISAETASRYVEASTALFLLARQWMDRLERAQDPQERILILGGFEAAREQVVRKVGLSGMAEFIWITETGLKNPANRKMLETAGLQLGSQ